MTKKNPFEGLQSTQQVLYDLDGYMRRERERPATKGDVQDLMAIALRIERAIADWAPLR